MTIDGVFDHTVLTPDEEIHQHYTDLLNNAGLILYGSTTYQLMQYWQPMVKKPSGEKSMDDFAIAIDKIPKIVFSHKLQDTGWDSASIANQPLSEMVQTLKQLPGKEILAGSRSLIIQLMKLNLIDEYQLCVHPIVAGEGLQLFENMNYRKILQFTKTKTFSGGAVILYYEPAIK